MVGGGSGLVGVAPGKGEIMMAPFSVCTRVPRWDRRLANYLVVPHPRSGLIGSPTVPASENSTGRVF